MILGYTNITPRLVNSLMKDQIASERSMRDQSNLFIIMQSISNIADSFTCGLSYIQNIIEQQILISLQNRAEIMLIW